MMVIGVHVHWSHARTNHGGHTSATCRGGVRSTRMSVKLLTHSLLNCGGVHAASPVHTSRTNCSAHGLLSVPCVTHKQQPDVRHHEHRVHGPDRRARSREASTYADARAHGRSRIAASSVDPSPVEHQCRRLSQRAATSEVSSSVPPGGAPRPRGGIPRRSSARAHIVRELSVVSQRHKLADARRSGLAATYIAAALSPVQL